MQEQATRTRRYGVNGVMALAIGSALLAALILGAVALNSQANLVTIGGSNEAAAPANLNRMSEIAFVEQNAWEYASANVATTGERIRFLENNAFEYAAPSNAVSMETVQFLEENTFEYAVPQTGARIKFLEENSWNYAPHAQFAEEASEPASAPDVRFIEENVWGESNVLPTGDTGQLDY